jgi:hypothetical protein
VRVGRQATYKPARRRYDFVAMTQRLRSVLVDITAALLFGLALALAVPQAHAEMIRIDPDRERVDALLARPEVVRELERMGIPAEEARARVGAMTPEEVRSLAGRIDGLPAGAQASTRDLLLVILVVLLVLILI